MTVDHATLTGWLTRLKLTAIRDQLDNLIDEAARRELTQGDCREHSAKAHSSRAAAL